MLQDPRVRGAGRRVRRQLARLPPLRGAQHRRPRALPDLQRRAARRRCSRSRSASSLDVVRRRPLGARLPLRQAHVRQPGAGEALRHAASRAAGADDWVRVDDAGRYGRGGLLPMAVFLTKNAPGLRTSPVKRGYWVVAACWASRSRRRPPVVPELPHDEAKLDLTLREMLARHRERPELRRLPRAVRLVRPGVRGLRPGRRAARPGPRRPAGRRPRHLPRRQRRRRASRACAATSATHRAGRVRRQPLPQAAGLRPGPQPAALRRAADRRDAARKLAASGYRFGTPGRDASSPAPSS